MCIHSKQDEKTPESSEQGCTMMFCLFVKGGSGCHMGISLSRGKGVSRTVERFRRGWEQDNCGLADLWGGRGCGEQWMSLLEVLRA